MKFTEINVIEKGEGLMQKQATAMLEILALGLGLVGSASAANFVDVTYDLSDTTLTRPLPDCPANGCAKTQLLGGSMKIRYTGNSQSSMPILHGPATLLSWTVLANVQLGTSIPTGFNSATQAINMKVSLLSLVAGSLLSSGTLAFGSAQIRVTGTRHCGGVTFTAVCIAFGGTLTSIFGALGPYTTHATFTLAASPGPYGGALSTRHTVSGTIPVYAPTKFAAAIPSLQFATGASVLGREVLREAEGHDPKVTPIPEPGTLLLLGAGAAGLVLIGRVTRRSRQG